MPHITIVELNDVHGCLEPHHEVFWDARGFRYGTAGGYARIARLIDDIRRERPGAVMVLDGGDTLHGTYPVVASQGQSVIPVLNRLGFDAMTAHWEFAYGPAMLEQRVAELSYPLLASNVYRKDGGERPYPATVVKEVGGVRVGVIGLASPIVDKTMPPHFSEGLRFETGNKELPDLVRRLRDDEKVDLVVLLSHAGFPQDMAMVEEVSGIDVCISAHTHNRLREPARVNGALVIQSGSHGSFVGRLDLEVEGGTVIDYRHRLITVDASIEPDAGLVEVIDDILQPHREMLNEVVGRCDVPLNRATAVESTMDNMLLDSLLHVTDAEIAFANGWRYGAPSPTGEIRMNDLWNMMPMNPPVSTVDLRGEEIIELLEENLERTYSSDPYEQMGGYLKRMAGANAYIRIENPKGQRIQRIFVGDKLLDRGQIYHAVFVTAQGVGPKYGDNRQDTGMKGVDALRTWVEARSPIRGELRGSFVAV